MDNEEVNKEKESEAGNSAIPPVTSVEEEYVIGNEVRQIDPIQPNKEFISGVFLSELPSFVTIGKGKDTYEVLQFKFVRDNNGLLETHVQNCFLPVEPKDWATSNVQAKKGKTVAETAKSMAINNYEFILRLLQAYIPVEKRGAASFKLFREGINHNLALIGEEAKNVPATILLSYNSKGVIEIPTIGNVISTDLKRANLIWDPTYHREAKPVREKASSMGGGGSPTLPPVAINPATLNQI